MSAAAPNPNNNMLLLAVLGIGAFWFMSRRSVMASPLTGLTLAQQQQQQANASKNNLIASGLNGVMGLIGKFAGSSMPTTVSGVGAALGGFSGTTIPAMGNWFGSTGFDYSTAPSLSDVVQNDGFALNPAGFTSGYDFMAGIGL